MSTDPYHAVQQEIQSSLETASTLRSSFLRIRSLAREGSEELVWARSELKDVLATLETDLNDLEDSVKMVEDTGPRYFGLEDAEVFERRRYVGRIRREIENMMAEAEGRDLSSAGKSPSTPFQSRSSLLSGSRSPLQPTPTSQSGELGDEQASWAREEEQLLLQEQDRTMDSISGTLNTLSHHAGLIGHELSTQFELIDDVEANVDRTESKLSTATRRMKKFVRDTEGKSRAGLSIDHITTDVRNRDQVRMVYNYSGNCTGCFIVSGCFHVRTWMLVTIPIDSTPLCLLSLIYFSSP